MFHLFFFIILQLVDLPQTFAWTDVLAQVSCAQSKAAIDKNDPNADTHEKT